MNVEISLPAPIKGLSQSVASFVSSTRTSATFNLSGGSLRSQSPSLDLPTMREETETQIDPEDPRVASVSQTQPTDRIALGSLSEN